MLQTVEGIYRDGKIELLEQPAEVSEARVIVTFIGAEVTRSNEVDLRARGIEEAQAASLRARLQSFAEDWERPEMEAYDAL